MGEEIWNTEEASPQIAQMSTDLKSCLSADGVDERGWKREIEDTGVVSGGAALA